MSTTERFLEVFRAAERKYKGSMKRLAAEGWKYDWHVLISTIMSAQSRDEVTIVIAEKLFRKYKTLKALANARFEDVLEVFSSLNYNKTKARHVIRAAQQLLEIYNGVIPKTIDELTVLSGVGRKTANLVITEVHSLPGICVDTHVHRIANVFGLVKTEDRDKTEHALKEIAPRKYWAKINRYFVLWGQDVSGTDKKKLWDHLETKN